VHDYQQIPALTERSKLRVANFYVDFDARLAEVPFVAGDTFSAADITTLVMGDFRAIVRSVASTFTGAGT
jgi:glutathione S-transferase